MGDNEFDIFQNYYQPDIDQTRFYDDDEDAIIVSQNLAPEQYQYEFPSKQCLKELEYLDRNQEFSFFDESSFTTTCLTVYSSVDQLKDQDCLVDDSRLSPLQLPAQMIPSLSNTSSTLIRPVGPSSFLSDKHHMSHVTPSRDLQKENDMESLYSCRSKVILIQLNKTSLIQRSCSISDEGYDDTEQEEKELESQCTFYPLCDDDEEEEIFIRDQAAIKIQAVWRGYHCRRNLKQPNAHIQNLAQQFHLRTVYKKIASLEHQLRQETAMRMAFEKAMEDMTVLVDQQQKVLYDRLEQEVHLRQMYENKLNTALPNLENKLKKEMNARSKLEDMMTRVLDQLHESETARIEQSKQQQELQSKVDLLVLNSATRKVTTTSPPKKSPSITTTAAAAKKSPSITTTPRPAIAAPVKKIVPATKTLVPATKTLVPATTKKTAPALIKKSTILPQQKPTAQKFTNNSSSHLITSKNLPVERPSVIPSNRRLLKKKI